MSTGLQILLIVLSICGLLAAMGVVHLLAQRYVWSAELQRKCVHMTTGLYALTLPLTFSQAWPVLLLCAISVVVMGIIRLSPLSRSGIGSTIHGVERESYGEILLTLAVGFTFFRSAGSPVLFVLPILVLTFSDAAAALAGVRYGRRLFAVEKGMKSLEGTTVFFLVTFILAMVTLLLMTDVSRVGVILLALIVAVFGAQLEADSWRGFDNLFVPIGLHLFLQNNLTASPSGLLGVGLLYVLAIAGLWIAAPSLRLTHHAARGYGVLAFLILSVSAPQNALLPLAAVVMFLVLRRRQPCASHFPDLDFLAAAAGIAALWLFLGEWSGHNAINLFNLTFAGVATIYGALAFRQQLFIPIGLSLVLGLCVFWIETMNSTAASWLAQFSFGIFAAQAFCCAVALVLPDLFMRYRAGRSFIVALVMPLLLLTIKSVAP